MSDDQPLHGYISYGVAGVAAIVAWFFKLALNRHLAGLQRLEVKVDNLAEDVAEIRGRLNGVKLSRSAIRE